MHLRLTRLPVLEHEEHEEHKEHKGLEPQIEAIGRQVIDSAFKVHRALGPGLLESAYEQCLAHELGQRGLTLSRQVPLAIRYEGLVLEAGYRLDLLVENAIVVEVKAVEQLSRLHEAQLLTYLRLSRRRLGFLLNFNVYHLRQGTRRLVL